MPVISKELHLLFSPTRLDRTAVITPRDPNELVGDFDPHYRMVPLSITGCEIQPVVIQPRGRIEVNTVQRLEIAPPLKMGEEFDYNVYSGCVLRPSGTIECPIRHPTHRITFTFSLGLHDSPKRYRVTLVGQGGHGDFTGGGEVTSGEKGISFTWINPAIGSQIVISWS